MTIVYCLMSKKKDKSKKKEKVMPPKEKQTSLNDDNDKPFDFGGLPERDLKKNLGCG